MAIPAELAELLSAHIAARGLTGADSDALIFANETGRPLSYSNWRRRVWVPAVVGVAFAALLIRR